MPKGVFLGGKAGENYAFIQPDDASGDIFVHRSDVQAGSLLQRGDQVEYEVATGREGKRKAVNVRKEGAALRTYWWGDELITALATGVAAVGCKGALPGYAQATDRNWGFVVSGPATSAEVHVHFELDAFRVKAIIWKNNQRGITHQNTGEVVCSCTRGTPPITLEELAEQGNDVGPSIRHLLMLMGRARHAFEELFRSPEYQSGQYAWVGERPSAAPAQAGGIPGAQVVERQSRRAAKAARAQAAQVQPPTDRGDNTTRE